MVFKLVMVEEQPMADVTQELMFEILKNLQQRFDKVDHAVSELRQDMLSIRGHLHNVQGDLNGIRSVCARIDDRTDRIEKRLDLREFAEAAQKPLTP